MSHHDEGRSRTKGPAGSEQHRGDFAEGQTDTHVPPDAKRGDYGRRDDHEDDQGANRD